MSSSDPPPSDDLTLSQLEHVHNVCLEFELAWKNGRNPGAEEFLSGVAGDLHVYLLRELLQLELEYRSANGDDVGSTELVQRFPNQAIMVQGIRASIDRTETRPEQPVTPVHRRHVRFPLRLNCPHCNNAVAVVDHGDTEEIECPSCGSSFQLDADRTLSWSPGKLPKIDQFQLLEPVGRGAFGTVYRAMDTDLDRIVAVKVPRSGSFESDDDEQRFIREARNAAQLTHPGIVPVYTVGRSDACPYIVSEFVQGVTLADVLTARQFSVREAAGLAVSLAEALQHAHQQGVTHRDLKPSNIMLQMVESELPARDDTGSAALAAGNSTHPRKRTSKPDHRPRIMDFGLALRDGGEVTVTMDGQILGTPAYMSPEQAHGQGHRADGRSDIYSLGVILFELVTGERPFRGNVRMLIHQVVNNEPPSPRTLNQSVPRDLETITLKCLHKSPKDRYQSAAEVSTDLAHWLAGEPINARPVSAVERSWRWCRRRPAAAGLTVTAVILVLAMVAVPFIYSSIRSRIASAEDKAESQQLEVALASLYSQSGMEFRQHVGVLRSEMNVFGESIRERWLDPRESHDHRIRLAGLMIEEPDLHDSVCDYLLDQLLEGDVDQIAMCRMILQSHSQRVAGELWEIVGTETDDDPRRLLGAASALALYAVDDDRWVTAATRVAAVIVTLPADESRDWAQLLLPAKLRLSPLVQSVILDSRATDGERVSAAAAFSVLWSADAVRLLELLVNVRPPEFRVLLNAVEQHTAEAEAWLTTLIEKHSNEQQTGPFPDETLVKRVESAHGLVTETVAICQTLPLSELDGVCNGLSSFGYRPVRCRPWFDGATVRVAAIWRRGDQRWQLAVGLTAAEVLKRNAQVQAEGFEPTDAAAYLLDQVDENSLRFVVVWNALESKGNRKLYLGTKHADWQTTFDAMRASNNFPVTIQLLNNDQGSKWRTQIAQPYDNGYAMQLSGTSFVRLNESLSYPTYVNDAGTILYSEGGMPSSRVGFIARKDGKFTSIVRSGTTPANHLEDMNALLSDGYSPASLSVIYIPRTESTETFSLWHRPASMNQTKVNEAQRRARAAIALCHLGNDSGLRGILASNTEPTCRSLSINWVADYGVPVDSLTALLQQETNNHLRRAVILCLGDVPIDHMSREQSDLIVHEILQVYREESDAGLHAAAEWTLRQWNQTVTFARTSEVSRSESDGKDWWINSKGLTMAMVRSLDAADNQAVAISTREISRFDFMRFEKDVPQNRRHVIDRRSASRPVGNVTWYQAAAYCNWLSEMDGIPVEQWCYQPNSEGAFAARMQVKPNALDLTGYRLPTVEEWVGVSSNRDQSGTKWFFGDSPDLLRWYCRKPENSQGHAWEGGSLRPGDNGLFDTLGNMAEYFHPVVLRRCGGRNKLSVPQGSFDVLDNTHIRVTHFSYTRELVSDLETTDTEERHPNTANVDTGFRVVRIIHLKPE